jgi:two-component system chemotaxis response regulator CheB
MVAAQANVLESALWSALRALEEKAELSRRLAGRIRQRGLERLALRYESAVEDAQRGSDTIRQLLLSGAVEPPELAGGDFQEQRPGWTAGPPVADRM